MAEEEPIYANPDNLDRLYGNIKQREVQTFDTVAAMQAATYLEAGMTCHTNGFHAAGDGGAAYYTVGTTGTANGMDVLALQGGLKATLVVMEPYVTPEMFGAYGDGTHDDTAAIQAAINYCAGESLTSALRNVYQITDTITIANDVTIDLSGATINFSGMYCFHIDGNAVRANIYNGILVGNNANTGIAFTSAQRCVVFGTVIRNVMYGINTRVSGTYGGGFRILNVTVQNDARIEGSIAIHDNGFDNVFINCIVRDFQIGTRTRTGKFYNFHAWISSPNYYAGSVFAQINGNGSTFTDCVSDSLQFGFVEHPTTWTPDCLITNFTFIRNIAVATDELIAEYPACVVYNPNSLLFPAISGVSSTLFPAKLYENAPSQISNKAQPTGVVTPDLFTNKPDVYTYEDTTNGIFFYRFGKVAMITITNLPPLTLAANATIIQLPTGFKPVGRVEFLDTRLSRRLFLAPSSTGGYMGTVNELTDAVLRGSVTYICE